MAEASTPPSVREGKTQNPNELKGSDTVAAAEQLVQLSGEEHENYHNNNEKTMMMKKKMVANPDNGNKNDKIMRREKSPDFEKVMMMMKREINIRDSVTSNNNSKTMKTEKATDSEKKKKVMKRMKAADSENDHNEGEVTSTPEARKEVKISGRKKQKYRSLRDIYKATEPIMRREKSPDFQKVMMKRKREINIRDSVTSNNNSKTMKTEKATDSEKKKKKVKKRMKAADSENDHNEGEVTSTPEARKEVKISGRKKQKYRSLRDIYKATCRTGEYY